jgi:CrcB protein
MARFWCSGVIARMFGETFPWGTLIVNISGSFVIGLIAALRSGHHREGQGIRYGEAGPCE